MGSGIHELPAGPRCRVCERVADGAPILQGTRQEPRDGEDSGWRFLCGSGDHDCEGADGEETLVAHLASVAEDDPAVLAFVDQRPGAVIERTSWVHVFERRDVADDSDGAFLCSACDQVHSGLPMDLVFPNPSHFDPDEEDDWFRDDGVAVWGGEHHFLRAHLQLPVVDGPMAFTYTVWMSVSPANFPVVSRLAREEDVLDDVSDAYFGWFSNGLPGFPDTRNLKGLSRFVPGERWPYVELEATEHPLAIAQRRGLRMARVHDLVAASTP